MNTNQYICKECSALWRKNSDGSWSLYDEYQEPKKCCDNNADFLSKIEPVEQSHE